MRMGYVTEREKGKTIAWETKGERQLWRVANNSKINWLRSHFQIEWVNELLESIIQLYLASLYKIYSSRLIVHVFRGNRGVNLFQVWEIEI